MPVVRGSCLCRSVKYEITGPLIRSGHCHCSNCRKAHGAAFRSRARVRVEDFKWVQGRELVKYFESSPGFHRGFCSVCGSPIVNRPDRTRNSESLGSLDDDPGIRPERHSFVASKAPWFEITDDFGIYQFCVARACAPGTQNCGRFGPVLSPRIGQREREGLMPSSE